MINNDVLIIVFIVSPYGIITYWFKLPGQC
jgi:hypothetical protein